MDEAELLVQVGALRKELRVVRNDRNAFVGDFSLHLSAWPWTASCPHRNRPFSISAFTTA